MSRSSKTKACEELPQMKGLKETGPGLNPGPENYTLQRTLLEKNNRIQAID